MLHKDINEVTNITDVDVDCLERVFNHLSLIDLLNVADSNKYLRRVAESLFVEKYGKKAISLTSVRESWSRFVREHYKRIVTMDFKTSLQLMRCFGHLISSIEFFSIGPQKTRASIEHFTEWSIRMLTYINDYCAEHLIEIKLIDCRKAEIMCLTKPFTKVETVDISCRPLEGDWLNQFFPKVKDLRIIGYRCENFDLACIAYNFPHLQHLLLNCSNQSQDTYKQNLLTSIRLNPRLKSFKQIFFGKPICDMSILQNTQESFQHLETLEASFHYHNFLNFNGFNPLHFANGRKLSMCLHGSWEFEESMPKIPLSFGKLEEFSFQTNFSASAEFYKFIERHPTIKKLNMEWLNTRNINAAKLAKALPLLTEIHIRNCKFLGRNVAQFMNHFKLLTKFSFHLCDGKTSELKQLADKHWEYQIDGRNRVDLQRCIEI